MCLNSVGWVAKSVDLDQRSHNVASELDLHYYQGLSNPIFRANIFLVILFLFIFLFIFFLLLFIYLFIYYYFFFFGGGWGGGGVGLRPFQEYFTYTEPIVHQKWAKT